MRVEAGPCACEASNGIVLHVDQPLSRSQVDLVLDAIDVARQSYHDVFAVEVDEGQVVVEWYWPDRRIVNGHIGTYRTVITPERVPA